jgi:hypothetical protein
VKIEQDRTVLFQLSLLKESWAKKEPREGRSVAVKTSFDALAPTPSPLETPPLGAKLADSTCQELMRQGKTASQALSGMLAESGAGCCFVSGGTGTARLKAKQFCETSPYQGIRTPQTLSVMGRFRYAELHVTSPEGGG